MPEKQLILKSRWDTWMGTALYDSKDSSHFQGSLSENNKSRLQVTALCPSRRPSPYTRHWSPMAQCVWLNVEGKCSHCSGFAHVMTQSVGRVQEAGRMRVPRRQCLTAKWKSVQAKEDSS